jgi:hypothetical protein
MGIVARPVPGKTLLSPDDHTLVLIDFQSKMAFATKSIDTTLLCPGAPGDQHRGALGRRLRSRHQLRQAAVRRAGEC